MTVTKPLSVPNLSAKHISQMKAGTPAVWAGPHLGACRPALEVVGVEGGAVGTAEEQAGAGSGLTLL